MSPKGEPSTSDSQLQLLGVRVNRYPHLLLIVAFMGFMLWTRLQGWKSFVQDGQVLFAGNDAWYHFRQTLWTVEHYPATMPFDPMTNYPYGNAAGQFGTLYDQLVATVALIVGAGSPDQQTVAFTLLFAPAVIGTLVAVPTYFLGKQYGGRLGGTVAVLILALTPGAFLQRSLVGFADHHIAEVLFQTLAMVAVVTMVSVADREKPVLELLFSRDFEPFRQSVGWATLAGISIALYIWVWPPGIVLAFILAVFFGLHLTVEVLRGRSPEHVALPAIVMFLVAAALTLVPLRSLTVFSTTNFTLLQPALLLLVAVALAGMTVLGRFLESRRLSKWYYPTTLSALGVSLVGFLRVGAPETVTYLTSQFLRVFGYSTGAATRTVGEAQPIPLGSAVSYFFGSYGLAFFFAVLAAVFSLIRYRNDSEPRGRDLLLVVWFVMLVMATLTQQRFDYYLAVPVAVLTGMAVTAILQRIDLDSVPRLKTITAAQVVVIVIIGSALIVPFALGGTASTPLTAQAVAQSNQPGEITQWVDSLTWLKENTPAEGTLGLPENQPLATTATTEMTADYQYPDGTYGVVSWWDYGHFITTLADRIPIANPHQQGSSTAANFLLATNESHATDLVTFDEGQSKYVMIDWKTAVPSSTKYGAPTAFYTEGNVSTSDLTQPLYQINGTSVQYVGSVQEQRHYDSMRVRLFQFHGSAVEPQPMVVDWESQQLQTSTGETVSTAVVPQDGQAIKQFDNVSAARAYVDSDGTSQVGGLAGLPEERIPALQHYRLVHASESQYAAPTLVGTSQGSWVKTFERVPGATVQGTAPVNSTVTASVELELPNNGSFIYQQQATAGPDGEFEMILPYSTTGYENWGPAQGYTNVSVKATGPYTLSAISASNGTAPVATETLTVSEAAVIGETTNPLTPILGGSTNQTSPNAQ
ncbi:oligosaccharyl transferase, archaeosortase A system-associated [Haloferax volcanii]|uniref:oligosaccharyl transferase, archaeosortase A system-associated n=1 Tax=Haloferax volcanii TaxID=2246 RepID=UPI0023DA9C23|nr:oligosaccharyl transferase, archaeosortase A system-associated [Haloferax lucentense]WEL27449.1 Dolichyl-phosphooligosaccharide-protein glycotransferase [Haloferax lucentense]